MKKDATQRATTEIANSWSAHSTIAPREVARYQSPRQGRGGGQGQCPGEHIDCLRHMVQGKEDSAQGHRREPRAWWCM